MTDFLQCDNYECDEKIKVAVSRFLSSRYLSSRFLGGRFRRCMAICVHALSKPATVLNTHYTARVTARVHDSVAATLMLRRYKELLLLVSLLLSGFQVFIILQ